MGYQGGYTVTENGSDYDRGHAAGQISERLREHDSHFERINGSLDKLALANDQLRSELVAQVGALTLSIQRMSDAAQAARDTMVTAAAAVKEAGDAAARRSERRWAPWVRLAVGAGAVATVAGAVVAIIAAMGGLR